MELGGSLTERGDLPVGRYCPIERVLGTIGNRSSMVLLREAMYGTTRFEELVSRTGLTETTTARKLRDLVTAGLLVKRPYREPGQRRRDEYVLTDAGTDLMPALMALLQWGNAHDTPPYPPELRHVDCGGYGGGSCALPHCSSAIIAGMRSVPASVRTYSSRPRWPGSR